MPDQSALPTLPMFSDADKHAECERELKLRRRNYPRWVEQGRMSVTAARRQILIMEAIAADYAAGSTLGLTHG